MSIGKDEPIMTFPSCNFADSRNLGKVIFCVPSLPTERHPTFHGVLTLYLFERDHAADAVAAAATAARSAAQKLWRTWRTGGKK